MRKALTLLIIALLMQVPGAAQADTDDLFTLSLKPNVLILMDGSGSMDDTDDDKYLVQYGVDFDGNGNTQCSQSGGGPECVSDLDVDGIANTRNDVALSVVLDLLDANGDGQVDSADEAALGVRLGLMYYTSGGDSGLRDGGDDGHPRTEMEYSFETIAPMGTPYANIKKAIIDPILAGTPDPKIVVGKLRGCAASPSEYSPDPSACGSGQEAEYTSGVLTTPPDQTRWGYALDDTPTAEALEYIEHYWLPEQLFPDPDKACRQNFIILITDGASDGFTDVDTIVASLYNGGTPKAHGLGVPPGVKDRFGNLIPIPGTSFTYEFTDKDSQLLTREFTKEFAPGATQIDIKLSSDVPGASPPGSCPLDCYAYDPNGDDADKVPPETLGYVGGLDSAIYGNGTKLENLIFLSSNILDPEPEYYAKTFAVGFAGGKPSELEAAAAAGGTGTTAFFPDTADDLTSAIHSAITTIQLESLSIASPAVPAARVGTSNALYLASFTPSEDPFWYGELTASPLQSDGTIQTDASGNITATPLWEAHTVLNGTSPALRNIKTVISGTTVQDFAKTSSVRAALNVTQDLDGNAVLNDDDGNWLIDYVRGYNGTNPAWKLGDIYHSSPVLIGPPSSSYVDLNLDRTIDPTFTAFRITYATRDRVLYAGSNAGMLHAFHAGAWTGTDYDTGTGAERWAFVPPNLLPQLQDMVNTHTFYVDGSPKVADVWLDGVSNDGSPVFLNNVKNPFGAEWHTVLVAGERRGGNAYFALDVTDPGTAAAPNPPKYLWTFTDTNLGQAWSQAAIGKVRLSLDNGVTTIERWVAFVGGGYLPPSDTSAVGKAFFVIDMNTGAKLWEFTVANDGSMDRIAAAPTAVDTDGDGFVDRVYVGDLNGTIWRFDLQAVGTTSGLGTLVTGWTGSQLFAANTGQPFYNKVAVAADPSGQLWVYGGTGNLNDLLGTASQDRFYAIKEAYPWVTGTPPVTPPPVVTDADLADTSGVNTLNVNDPVFAGTLGWYLPLPASGEKILTDPEVFAQVLLFTSFTPTVSSCTSKGGTSHVYALSYLTGGGATDYAAFKAGTEGLSKALATVSGLSSGNKISMPVRTSTGASSGGDVVLFVCTSSELCGNPPPPQPGALRSIDYWTDL